MVGPFDDEVPVVGFGRMKDLDSLISRVNIMSVGQDVKVPSSYERYLQREESVGMIRMWRRRKEGHLLKSCLLLDNFTPPRQIHSAEVHEDTDLIPESMETMTGECIHDSKDL